ncbi:MAG TPA: PRC-barrel domain-containing protein [Nitrospiraceae bacterium]|nr:PRC-barrel domain-containing protein [Nitrospiraceae bacterium]
MKTQDFGKKLVRVVALGALVVSLVTGFGLRAEARDKSGVLKASELIGMSVQDTYGKKLGDIKDLVIDPEEGGVEYAVLEFGGFAGIGDKYFAVPWEAFQLDHANKKLMLDVHKKDLKNAPGFDKSNWPDLSLEQVVIYEFYEVPQSDRAHSVRSKR